MKKLFLCFISAATMLFFPCLVEAEEINVEEKYKQDALDDAANMQQKFDNMEKPKFQKAYDDYLNDLKLLEQHGIIQDNQELYDDLRAMNSDEAFIYSQNKPDKRPKSAYFR